VPEYVVCAENSRECKFDIVSSSLVQVLEQRVEERRKTLGDDKAANLLQKLEAHCDKARARGRSEAALRTKRAKDCVAASLSQLGVVVPVDSKTNTGFRELPTTGRDLADLLRELEQDAGKKSAARKRLSELITRATIASDECDFGTGLLLGLDVFTAGRCLEVRCKDCSAVSTGHYVLLNGVFAWSAEGSVATASSCVHAATPRQLLQNSVWPLQAPRQR
jgi:hypothetical protein